MINRPVRRGVFGESRNPTGTSRSKFTPISDFGPFYFLFLACSTLSISQVVNIIQLAGALALLVHVKSLPTGTTQVIGVLLVLYPQDCSSLLLPGDNFLLEALNRYRLLFNCFVVTLAEREDKTFLLKPR